MEQIIIDLNAGKYKKVCCPNPKCESDEDIEVNEYYNDEEGTTITEYHCKKCGEVFIKNNKYNTCYEDESDLDNWHDLTENMKLMFDDKKLEESN